MASCGDSGSSTFTPSLSTVQDVKQNYVQWGRTASVPYGALRGGQAPLNDITESNMHRSMTDVYSTPGNVQLSSLSLKRGMSEDDTDAVLAEAFGDDDGEMDDSMPPTLSSSNDRPMRSLPRQGLRPTQSMPPKWQGIPVPDSNTLMDMSENESDTASEPFRQVDFSAYASYTDGF